MKIINFEPNICQPMILISTQDTTNYLLKQTNVVVLSNAHQQITKPKRQ